MGVQHRLAAHFRRLAAEDPQHFEAWAAFVEARPDDDEHVLAIARAQADLGDPPEFTPWCDNGLHLRLLGKDPPNERRFAYIASLEGLPEPWVYGDWAKQGPPPERDGVPQWTVDVDVMANGAAWEWPPRIDHPDVEKLTHYGWGEVWPSYVEQHLTATLKVWAQSEAAALALTHRLIGDHLTRWYVIARRVRARRTEGEWEDKPRRPEDLTVSVHPVRWQRADVDAGEITIAWRERGDFDHITVDERPDRVTVTVHARFGPVWSEDGLHIIDLGEHFAVRSERIAVALGDRRLVDGATGRAPDDLSIWEHHEREEREQVLRARLRP